MSISSYINMIRSASSAYEMRSEIVGALLSLNNNYSVFSVYTPQDNNAFPCAKEGSQNYWGLIQNGNDAEFPFAESLFGSKTVNQQGIYKASDDNLAAYSTFTFSISEYAVSISLNLQIYNFPTNIVTKIEATGLGKNYPIKSIIERTIDNLWDSNAPDPSQEYLYAGCDRIASAYFPNCSSIAAYAFASCSALTTASFPVCTYIGSSAFQSCSALTTTSFPACTYIGSWAFQSCSALTSISFPACTYIGEYAFNGCYSLTSISFPVCTSIEISAFAGCSALISANFPACTNIGNYAFYRCSALSTASFPACIYIGACAFSYCFTLISLYLLGSSLVTLYNSAVFSSTPIGGYSNVAGQYGNVYVPSSLYNLYLSDPHWGRYSNRIISI